MTRFEKLAVENFFTVRFVPGSFDKRFVRDMLGKPQAILTMKQKVCLWNMVHRYRRQLPSPLQEMAKAHLAMLDEWKVASEGRQPFELALTVNPGDCELRLVYSDFLEERGDLDLAEAQRFMVKKRSVPEFSNAGVSYGPGTDFPINFSWLFEPEIWRHFSVCTYSRDYLGRWHKTRMEAEQALANAISGRQVSEVISHHQ